MIDSSIPFGDELELDVAGESKGRRRKSESAKTIDGKDEGRLDSLALSGDGLLEDDVGLVWLALKDVETRLEEDWKRK